MCRGFLMGLLQLLNMMVRGNAQVDEESGCNYFELNEEGLHCYVVRLQEPEYYAKQINDIIN